MIATRTAATFEVRVKPKPDERFEELRIAIAQDLVAKSEAMQRGMDATQPLSSVRLAELCALGEKMMSAALRRTEAEGNLQRTGAECDLKLILRSDTTNELPGRPS